MPVGRPPVRILQLLAHQSDTENPGMTSQAKSLRPADQRGPSGAARHVHVRDGRGHWCVREEWRERLLGAGAPDWFHLDEDSRAEPVKRGRGRAVWRVGLDESVVFAKLLRTGNLLERVKARILGGAAEREWRAACEAERRGVAAVRGLASGSKSDLDRTGVYLSEGIDNVSTLAEFWAHRISRTSGWERRHRALRLIESVAALSADAHEAGFVHRDGHPGNILVRQSSLGHIECIYADVLGAHFSRGPASVRRSVYALVQLHHYFKRFATRTERLRFLAHYLARRDASNPPTERHRTRKRWVRSILNGASAHAVRLARQRDRRLFRDDKYFARIFLRDGWTATVVLKLARRHVFPERHVPDRSIEQWRNFLDSALTAPSEQGHDTEEIRVEIARPTGYLPALAWRLFGSTHRQAFLRCHRNRHRDAAEPLILGFAEHRCGSVVNQTLLFRAKTCCDPNVT